MISEIHNMDCMELMRQYPDKHFDLAVVDPPYGIDINSSGTHFKEKYSIKIWDKETPKDEYFKELFRVSKHQIIWGGNYFLLPPSRGFIIWRKTSVAETFSMAMAEYAWISIDMNAKVFDGAPQGTKSDPRIHPTQKPIALYDWIFKNYAKEGQLILDTHLGSGSSRIAADRAGLNFVGCELDADYFAAHEKRWNEYKAQLKLL